MRPHCQRIPVSCVLVALCLLVALPPAQAGDLSTYDGAMARAAALEKAGKPDRAAAALQKIERRFRQDYTLQLRLGWLHFEAGDHARSARHYRRALSLSPGSKDARHGLAWALLRLGRRASARARFQQVLDRWPDTTVARRGLAMAQDPARVTLRPTAYLTGQVYQDHPTKSGAVGATVSLPVQLWTHGLLGVTYRYGHFWTTDSAQQSLGLDETFDQHELYLSAGVSYARFGVVAQYAYISDGSGYLDYAHVAGITARYSPWGDITLSANVGMYSDMTVVSVSPAWRLPVLSWLSVTPGLTVQAASSDSSSLLLSGETSETLVAGTLTVTAHGRAGSLWVGGRYGDQVRMANLSSSVVYNTADRNTFGLWAGGRLSLSDHWSLFLSYELEGLETSQSSSTGSTTGSSTGDSTSTSSLMHLMTAGVTWTF